MRTHCYGCDSSVTVDEAHPEQGLREAGWVVQHGETYCPICASEHAAPAAAVPRAAPRMSAQSLPISTGPEIPGARVCETLGLCFGLIVRSMGFSGSLSASFKALKRGEVTQYTELLEDSRRHAIDRMIDNARLLGADGIISMRFDSSEIGDTFTEIVAYGTAVRLERAG